MSERPRFFTRRKVLQIGTIGAVGATGLVKGVDWLADRSGDRFADSAADTLERRVRSGDFAKQQIADFKRYASKEDWQQFLGQTFVDSGIDAETVLEILKDPHSYAEGTHKETEHGSSDISCIAEGAPEPEEK